MLFFHHLYKPTFTVMFSFMLGELCALVYVCFLEQGRLIWFSLLWFKLSPSCCQGLLSVPWTYSTCIATTMVTFSNSFYFKDPSSYVLLWAHEKTYFIYPDLTFESCWSVSFCVLKVKCGAMAEKAKEVRPDIARSRKLSIQYLILSKMQRILRNSARKLCPK